MAWPLFIFFCMNIKIAREDNQPSHQLFATEQADALTIIRKHVRAYDSDDDSLLLIYLDAALDYMQNLSDRLLGTHDVEVYINKDESNHPVTVPGVQGVTSLGNLYYLSEDADNDRPWSKEYKVYSDVPVSDDVGNLASWGSSVVYEAENGSYTIDSLSVASSAFGEVEGLTALAFTWEYNSKGTYLQDYNVTGHTFLADGSENLLTDKDLSVGLYRVKMNAIYSDASQKAYYRYFEVSDGMDFDNRIITNRYPIHIDIRNWVDVLDDAADEQEDFWKLTLTAGTALSSLPKQYKQAALLLVGHYYNMREAENIGGISSELKEGVKRLIQSVRQY